MSLLIAMTVDSLFRPIVERSAFAGKIARFLARLGVTPNFLSVLSLIFAAISGILFAVSSRRRHTRSASVSWARRCV